MGGRLGHTTTLPSGIDPESWADGTKDADDHCSHNGLENRVLEDRRTVDLLTDPPVGCRCITITTDGGSHKRWVYTAEVLYWRADDKRNDVDV